MEPLPGYRPPRPMVYCGLYPTYPKDFEALRKALQTLSLNDASISRTTRRRRRHSGSDSAADFSACCTWRSCRNVSSVRADHRPRADGAQTSRTRSCESDGDVIRVEKPSDVPDTNYIDEFREPIARCNLILSNDQHRSDDETLHRAARHLCPDAVPVGRRACHARVRHPAPARSSSISTIGSSRSPAATARSTTRSRATKPSNLCRACGSS